MILKIMVLPKAIFAFTVGLQVYSFVNFKTLHRPIIFKLFVLTTFFITICKVSAKSQKSKFKVVLVKLRNYTLRGEYKFRISNKLSPLTFLALRIQVIFRFVTKSIYIREKHRKHLPVSGDIVSLSNKLLLRISICHVST